MTLNLMLTSADAVYLSGDFRRVSVEDQAALPDSYDTQKLVPVFRRDWMALIAYMGIQSAPPLIDDMGQWIVDRIDGIPRAADFSQLSTRLLELNHLLPRVHGDRRVALSVVGFRRRRPFMMLLSNFVDLDGHVTPAGPQLTPYLRTPNTPEVRAVGTARPDVFERVRLVRMLRANASRGVIPPLIRETMAEINASVARRSNGSISEACVSGYLLRSGAAAIGGHGIPPDDACFPRWLKRDLEQSGISRFEPHSSVESVRPAHWKGTTARIEKDVVLRTHRIANAGHPVVDAVERRGRPPTWTLAAGDGTNIVSITFADTLDT